MDDRNIGLEGLSTQIVRALDKIRKDMGEKVELDAGGSASYLICKLTGKHTIPYQEKSSDW